MFWTYLGLAIILLVAGQLVVGLLVTLRRNRIAAARSAFEIARFTEELAAVRDSRRKLAQEPVPWNGFRKFVVRRKVEESPLVRSFYLEPHDSKPLPGFRPGQYLTFRLPSLNRYGQLIRCYSLSDHPQPTHYRVTIKRALPPRGNPAVDSGLGSGFFHDQIDVNDILDLRAPAGNFFLDPADPEAVVLVGCGIGLTPIYSMLATLVHAKSRRTVWFYYGVRNGGEHLFRSELAAIARDNPHIHLRICYSQPRPEDRLGEDYHVHARVTVDLLKSELPSNNFHFYYCGPSLMMESMTNGLKDWGVPASHLHFETFGPLSVQRVSKAVAGAQPFVTQQKFVTFRKSGTAVPWDGSHATLLDLAEQAGVVIPSGCRTGNCGTCVVALQEGDVTYIQPPGTPPEARTCLTCIAQPKGDLVLDA
jgi:ferredoxin-NADP reductase